MNSRSRQNGYALFILMMAVTILLISLTAVLPSASFEAQREREAELIFRGNEYARAIYFYNRQFHRYPHTVEELIKPTNGIRFLRHAYTDPMTKDGKWRFIHVSANGAVLDSKVQVAPSTGLLGSQQLGSTAGSGTSAMPGLGQATPADQGQSAGTGGSPQAGAGSNPPAQESGDTATNPPADQTGNPGDQSGGAEQTQGGGFLSGPPGSQLGGGFIIGVASTSRKKSIRVWNNQTRYDRWEFLGTMFAAAGFPGLPSQAGQPASGQPGGPPGLAQPPATPGANPDNPQPGLPPGQELPPLTDNPGSGSQEPPANQ